MTSAGRSARATARWRRARRAGHQDVHQDDVGLVLGHRLRDLAAVRGLADDLDVFGAGDQHGESS
jgi:hypothetical protein